MTEARRLLLPLLFLLATAAFAGAADSGADWPWWRGPTRNGVAPEQPAPPTKWSETENVVWKADVPGRGHGSPTVVGERVFLATADEEREIHSVLCFDRKSGKRVWKTDVHRGGLDRKGNKKTSQASSTVACDDERLFVNFVHDGAMHTTALDLAGRQLWQVKVCDFQTHQGFGSSPAIYGSLVIVSADNRGGGLLAAFDRQTGERAWRQDRPKLANYTSPVILRAAGRDQVVLSGCNLLSSFDPASGKKLWEVEGSTTECVTSVVTDGERVFGGGGYPKKHTVAVEADGSGEIAWQNKSGVYVPSMLVHEQRLYAVTDAGVAICYDSATGETAWKARLGGKFSSSLVLVGDLLFATSEAGRTFIFKANPAKYVPVAENDLGDEAYATAAICGGRIYLRVAHREGGERRETLYCIGRK